MICFCVKRTAHIQWILAAHSFHEEFRNPGVRPRSCYNASLFCFTTSSSFVSPLACYCASATQLIHRPGCPTAPAAPPLHCSTSRHSTVPTTRYPPILPVTSLSPAIHLLSRSAMSQYGSFEGHFYYSCSLDWVAHPDA
ncbi:hypothetical protein E2C01_049918 [Portunus trituberculatus]|uniref:Uncharacterized protein n=1 Tax=Portunus trituberculatus TaxID=210409 RepID=A0A5B7G6V7_PORTR|nr:hypothetical protein [Portunus trituberculatus]